MVVCAVFGCNSRSGKKHNAVGVRFFTFPTIHSKADIESYDLISQRRSLWINRIARKDLTLYDGNKIVHARVCSKHFIKGEPSVLKDTSNPDWAPSINLGHNFLKQKIKAKKRKSTLQNAAKDYISDMKVYKKGMQVHVDEGTLSPVDKDEDCIFTAEENEDTLSPVDADEDCISLSEEDEDTISPANELASLDEESITSSNENSDKSGQDKLKYFIFESNKSKTNYETCSVTHKEALTCAETLLCYMNEQDHVDNADRLLIQNYIWKIKEKIFKEELVCH